MQAAVRADLHQPVRNSMTAKLFHPSTQKRIQSTTYWLAIKRLRGRLILQSFDRTGERKLQTIGLRPQEKPASLIALAFDIGID